MNFLNAQKLCVFSFTLTDQCVSSTSVKSPTYTVATPSSYVPRATDYRIEHEPPSPLDQR